MKSPKERIHWLVGGYVDLKSLVRTTDINVNEYVTSSDMEGIIGKGTD